MNFTEILAANTTLDILLGVNSAVSNNLFWWFAILALGVVAFINLSYYGSPSALALTSFIVAIISGLMWIAGLLPLYALIVSILLVFISVVLVFFME